MAIEKTRLDQESKQISILEERNQLAHEIHDSLAQTLASLRFQVRTLETAARQTHPELEAELSRLREGIYEGNREVRELISHFRAPVDKRGLKHALEKVISDIRQDKNLSVFVQEQWKYVEQPEVHEHQIVRIVQEAFCNARKHADARTLRLLLKGNPHDGYEVLIEDDGVGITRELESGGPGDHIGLTVMQERAKRIGGSLTIESEAGEGTRILLRFPHNAEKALPEPEVRSLFQ
jgi:two-component system nitrate/nitrite sensor histidine kinase NarX